MEIGAVPFLYKNITVISQKQFDAHMTLYKGYITKTNEITQILSDTGGQREANATYSHYRGLKQGETFALDGVILHELYFENIGGTAHTMSASFSQTVQNNFAGKQNFMEDFRACATASRGWAILCYEQRTQTYRNISLDAHNFGVVAYMVPLLVIDMYEHAYFLDYTTDKAKYIDSFVKDINWPVVEKRVADCCTCMKD